MVIPSSPLPFVIVLVVEPGPGRPGDRGTDIRRIKLTTLVAVSLVLFGAALPIQSAAASRAEPYIVVLRGARDPASVASDHARRHGAQVRFVYGHALNGYAATIPSTRVDDVRSDPRVAYVVRDASVTIRAKRPRVGSGASAQTTPWGITMVGATLSSTQAGDGSGAVGNVNVYVIDTGVDSGHPDLNVVNHVNFAGGRNKDCHGHGTHVAGTIAAKDNSSYVVGAAPGAPITGVKVLGCSGSGTMSGVIMGVDWVTANAHKPAIANMSLGGGAYTPLDDAVRRSAASGVFYSIAAGNSGADACNSSPARAGAGTDNGIATVAATDSSDIEASWSNYGGCVDIWAPGVNVLSTRKGGGTTTMSGTSMAAPHVGGGGALYLQNHTSASASDVETQLKLASQAPGTLSKDGAAISREFVATF